MSDEGEPAELIWASATVSSVDPASGEFEVSITEWASLPANDPDFEEAYTDGPFVAAQENEYSRLPGYEGRWRRSPRIAAEWTPWQEAVSPAAMEPTAESG